jgi:hypothetical protein
VEQFHTLSKRLREPFKTMVLLQLCLGSRMSELPALRCVDRIGSKLNVQHGIVNQYLDAVTEGSRKIMRLDPACCISSVTTSP